MESQPPSPLSDPSFPQISSYSGTPCQACFPVPHLLLQRIWVPKSLGTILSQQANPLPVPLFFFPFQKQAPFCNHSFLRKKYTPDSRAPLPFLLIPLFWSYQSVPNGPPPAEPFFLPPFSPLPERPPRTNLESAPKFRLFSLPFPSDPRAFTACLLGGFPSPGHHSRNSSRLGVQ